MDLLERLKKIQDQEKLSNIKFAEKIGVSHQLWQKVRAGDRELRLTVIKGVMNTYPELWGEVISYILGRKPKTKEIKELMSWCIDQ